MTTSNQPGAVGAVPPAVGLNPIAAAIAAVSVGLLTAGTLGTVAAVIVGATLHVIGMPGAWATTAGAAVVAASLLPSARLPRRVLLRPRPRRPIGAHGNGA